MEQPSQFQLHGEASHSIQPPSDELTRDLLGYVPLSECSIGGKPVLDRFKPYTPEIGEPETVDDFRKMIWDRIERDVTELANGIVRYQHAPSIPEEEKIRLEERRSRFIAMRKEIGEAPTYGRFPTNRKYRELGETVMTCAHAGNVFQATISETLSNASAQQEYWDEFAMETLLALNDLSAIADPVERFRHIGYESRRIHVIKKRAGGQPLHTGLGIAETATITDAKEFIRRDYETMMDSLTRQDLEDDELLKLLGSYGGRLNLLQDVVLADTDLLRPGWNIDLSRRDAIVRTEREKYSVLKKRLSSLKNKENARLVDDALLSFSFWSLGIDVKPDETLGSLLVVDSSADEVLRQQLQGQDVKEKMLPETTVDEAREAIVDEVQLQCQALVNIIGGWEQAKTKEETLVYTEKELLARERHIAGIVDCITQDIPCMAVFPFTSERMDAGHIFEALRGVRGTIGKLHAWNPSEESAVACKETIEDALETWHARMRESVGEYANIEREWSPSQMHGFLYRLWIERWHPDGNPYAKKGKRNEENFQKEKEKFNAFLQKHEKGMKRIQDADQEVWLELLAGMEEYQRIDLANTPGRNAARLRLDEKIVRVKESMKQADINPEEFYEL